MHLVFLKLAHCPRHFLPFLLKLVLPPSDIPQMIGFSPQRQRCTVRYQVLFQFLLVEGHSLEDLDHLDDLVVGVLSLFILLPFLYKLVSQQIYHYLFLKVWAFPQKVLLRTVKPVPLFFLLVSVTSSSLRKSGTGYWLSHRPWSGSGYKHGVGSQLSGPELQSHGLLVVPFVLSRILGSGSPVIFDDHILRLFRCPVKIEFMRPQLNITTNSLMVHRQFFGKAPLRK